MNKLFHQLLHWHKWSSTRTSPSNLLNVYRGAPHLVWKVTRCRLDTIIIRKLWRVEIKSFSRSCLRKATGKTDKTLSPSKRSIWLSRLHPSNTLINPPLNKSLSNLLRKKTRFSSSNKKKESFLCKMEIYFTILWEETSLLGWQSCFWTNSK